MKRVIFIGQAMPRSKKSLHDWPSLNSWLNSIGISDSQIKQNFYYSALVDYFPGSKNGSHRVPTEEEINRERKRLAKTIKDFDPEIIVTIGKLSLLHCLQTDVSLLKDFIGKTFQVDPYGLVGRKVVVIPLPHPSGASAWRHKPENKVLLGSALKLLKENL
jgi:uracil-DNA glycosylase